MSNELDLTNCDREKIHLVGAIQPQGYFIAYRNADKTVYHVSENIADLVALKPSDAVGKSLQSVLGDTAANVIIRTAKSVGASEKRYARIYDVGTKKGQFEIYLFDFDGLIAIEIEEQFDQDTHDFSGLSESHRRNQSFVEQLETGDTLASIARQTCRAIRSIIGFDRVMMYRYFANWDGEVIAEDKSAEAHSFLQHRFPASDIPLPARQLYLQNRSRLIADSSALPVRIEPQTHYITRRPIDLTHSKLRAVSPIHLEYLRNMGVKSSFSVAVIVKGELWGLIACHSGNGARISHEERLACETAASTFAALATMKEQLGVQMQSLKFEENLRLLFTELIKSSNLVSELMKRHSAVESLFQATGVALVTKERVEIAGLTPPEAMIRDLGAALKRQLLTSQKSVIAVDNLESLDPQFAVLREISCGIVATYSPNTDDSLFMVFRPEVLRTITWGGDPRKTMEKREYQGAINPRKSFASWEETVSGHSAPWTKFQVKGAEFLRDFVFNSLVPKERLLGELGKRFST